MQYRYKALASFILTEYLHGVPIIQEFPLTTQKEYFKQFMQAINNNFNRYCKIQTSFSKYIPQNETAKKAYYVHEMIEYIASALSKEHIDPMFEIFGEILLQEFSECFLQTTLKDHPLDKLQSSIEELTKETDKWSAIGNSKDLHTLLAVITMKEKIQKMYTNPQDDTCITFLKTLLTTAYEKQSQQAQISDVKLDPAQKNERHC